MFLFVLAIILLLGTAGFVVAAIRGPRRAPAAATAVGSFLLAAVFLFLSTMAVVSTQNVGIETQFNRPIGELDNGLHWIAPWDSVTEMDATIQTDNHDQSQSACINVRIAHQIIACADVTIRWRIHADAADSLFQNYRTFENVRDSLVTRELATDLNGSFQDYDPLAVDDNGNSTATPLGQIASQTQQQMVQQIGVQVDVLSVFVPVLHFDQATQDRINALQAQIAQTRIAQQAIKTAQAQAAANAALSQSVSNDPNVLVSKCLDSLNEMIGKGQQVPAGFSCWPGGGTGVVLPSGH